MSHKYQQELLSVSDGLQAVMDGLERNLSNPELVFIKSKVAAGLQVQQNFIHALLGIPVGLRESVDVQLAPVTQVLGQRIALHEPVKAADLKPGADEQRAFTKARNELYTNFLSLTDDELAEKVTVQGGESLVRAVAKKAGVEDYLDARVNVVFFRRIRKCIKELEAAEKALTRANKSIRKK